MQQVNPEVTCDLSRTSTSTSIKSIVVRILSGYTLISLIVDIICMIHGLSVINQNKIDLSPSEVTFGRIWLIVSTILSFFLGFTIIVSIAFKRRYITIGLGICFIIFVFSSLRFIKVNYSLIGLVSNAIITLISVLIAVLIKNWKRT